MGFQDIIERCKDVIVEMTRINPNELAFSKCQASYPKFEVFFIMNSSNYAFNTEYDLEKREIRVKQYRLIDDRSYEVITPIENDFHKNGEYVS